MAIETKGTLTEEETETLIRRVLSSVEGGAIEDEMVSLGAWANEQRLGAVMVEMILSGEILVKAINDGGEPLLALPDA